MSKYTTSVRHICEHDAGLIDSEGLSNVDDIINKSWRKILGDRWPIFDESYRSVLAYKILTNYYTREICDETVGRWKLRIQSKLNEIMPFYNKMYELHQKTLYNNIDVKTTSNTTEDTNKTSNQATNIVDASNRTTEQSTNSDTSSGSSYSGTNTNTSTSTNNTTNKNKDSFSDTPQGALTDIENGNYLTNARIINGESETESETESDTRSESNSNGSISQNSSGRENSIANATNNKKFDSTEAINDITDYINTVVGKNSSESYLDVLLKYRDSMFNIDSMIIKDLSKMFFGLY